MSDPSLAIGVVANKARADALNAIMGKDWAKAFPVLPGDVILIGNDVNGSVETSITRYSKDCRKHIYFNPIKGKKNDTACDVYQLSVCNGKEVKKLTLGLAYCERTRNFFSKIIDWLEVPDAAAEAEGISVHDERYDLYRALNK